VNVLEGLRNTTRFRGNRGYYTSGIRFEIMQTQEGTYNYELLGEQAFCKKGEQCAGLYAIAEGKTKVLFNGEVITNDYNPLIKFSIDTITRECEVEILDFRVKKKLTKFKGELYE